MYTNIWAHRGASYYEPENSLEAFALAIEQGADGVELDIHLTRDGNLVVIHDHNLNRITGTEGIVEEMTVSELEKRSIIINTRGRSDIKIPLLEEVFELIKPTNLMMNIEIKEFSAPNPALIKKADTLAKQFNMQDRIMYCSFNHYSLRGLKELNPTVKIGLLYDAGLLEPWEYAKHANAEFMHPLFYWMLADGEIERAHNAGIKINTWTVDDPIIAKQLMAQGVDGIITNRPDTILNARKEYQICTD